MPHSEPAIAGFYVSDREPAEERYNPAGRLSASAPVETAISAGERERVLADPLVKRVVELFGGVLVHVERDARPSPPPADEADE